MGKRPSEATLFPASQEMSRILWNPKYQFHIHERPLCPYPEPVRSTPYPHIPLSEHQSQYYPQPTPVNHEFFVTLKSPICAHKGEPSRKSSKCINRNKPHPSLISTQYYLLSKSLPRSIYFSLHSRWMRIPLLLNSVSTVRERQTAVWTPLIVNYRLPLMRLLFTTPSNSSPKGLDPECAVNGNEVPIRSSEYFASIKWLGVGVLQDDFFHPLTFATQCTTKILESLILRNSIDYFSLWQNLEKYTFPHQKLVSKVFFFL